jgi:hypothetical protein
MSKGKVEWLRLIVLLIAVFSLLIGCAVFKHSPKVGDLSYVPKNCTPTSFSKKLILENSITTNQEVVSFKGSSYGDINFNELAIESGICFSETSSKYDLLLDVKSSSNFNFSTRDFLISFPFHLWATMSIISLAIIPTYIHEQISLSAQIKNLATGEVASFERSLTLNSWVSIIFISRDLKSVKSISKDLVELELKNLFLEVKKSIDFGRI